MPLRSYSRDEVEAILANAVEREHGEADRFTQDDLFAIGKELGVSREAIELAAAGIGDDIEVQRHVRARVQRMRRAFLLHLVAYILASVFLVTVDLEPLEVTYRLAGSLWFVWIILAWGVGIVGHAVVALAPNRDRIEAKVRPRVAREREKLRRRYERAASEDASRVRVEPRAQAKRVDVAAANAANDEEAEAVDAAAVRRSAR